MNGAGHPEHYPGETDGRTAGSAAVVVPALVGGVLGHEYGRAAVFAAGGEALDHSAGSHDAELQDAGFTLIGYDK